MGMNTSPPGRPSSLGSHPAALLVVVTVAGWLAFALWPRLFRIFGINDLGQWYLDSYAVLAALDAVRAGQDPHLPNALDPLMRYHVYSDWWLALRWLGLSREVNFLVGTAWVAAFAVTCWLTAKPKNLRETALMGALLLSPPVMLAVNRANNDLVIFVLLAWCAVAAAGSVWWRQILAVGALGLATGLKYYPVVAALAFVWVRPVRLMPRASGLALLVALGALASVWSQVSRGRFLILSSLHEMGAPLLGREFGWSDPTSQAVWLLAAVLAALVLASGRFTVGLATQGRPGDRLLAALGVIVLLACFAAGVNYAYRWIFSLWMVLWLWRQAAGLAATARTRWTVRLGLGLLFFCFWSDGILCFVVNVLLPSTSMIRPDALQVTWRLWTQPLHWLLMLLLAGWLLEALAVILQEWRKDAGPAPSHE
jgi:hypothetical protein